MVRETHDVIHLPCEKDKFGAGTAFTDQWITGGSMRYSPIQEELLALHRDAAAAREKAGSVAEVERRPRRCHLPRPAQAAAGG